MKRKDFIKKIGIGTIGSMGILTATSCGSDDGSLVTPDPEGCSVSPAATKGPFPIKSPNDFIRENIVGDRVGIALAINIKLENTNDGCKPLVGALVDIWHCDAAGNYSEYNGQLEGDFTSKHFLRGRQTTNTEGVASFVTIYPGWYPGRAPHLHLEILSKDGKSLLVTQTAFPEGISKAVYATASYKGDFDTSNAQDGVFESGLSQSMADAVTGNITDGYVLNETIKVAG